VNQSIILHHYQGSPYSEKIRLMFGYTNTAWFSLLSPAQPPRPNLDPLTGGYRRIPVAQMGGSRVEVAPEDYCVVPVVGTFAALTRDRIVLARETSEFGRLHIHFPRAAYSITAK
jgi:hypothetical protein